MFSLLKKRIFSFAIIIMVVTGWCCLSACSGGDSSSEPRLDLTTPSNPTPATNAVNTSTNLLLKWDCNITGGTYTYDLYLGTATNPPLIRSNIQNKQLPKDSLMGSTKYYWKVVVKDGLGNQGISPIWNFTTGEIPLDGRGGGIIAYNYFVTTTASHQIWAVNADGTGNRRIISTTLGLNHLEWSPDGTKITCVGYMDGTNTTWSIHTFNVDGTNLTRLTNTTGVWDAEPVYSPDGTRIAFTRIQKAQNDKNEIWIMNADGSNPHYIGIDGFQMKWSNDGTRFLYTSGKSGNWEIYTCNTDGTNEQRLTNNAFGDYNAAWSPDNTKIAFSSDRDGDAEIYIMNLDGTGLVKLTNNSYWDGSPKWSPDGTKFAFGAEGAGSQRYEIYIMNIDGTNVRKLVTVSNSITTNNPAWRPVVH